MKKVRITAGKDSKGKNFPIFTSPEAIYVWLHDSELRSSQKLDPSLGTMVLLRPGETMEVEWIGCEFLKEEGRLIRFDQIRLAKTMNIKSLNLDSNKIIGVHSGWIIDDILSFKSSQTGGIRSTKLTNKSKHKFDIVELFISRGLINEEDEYNVEPEDLQ